MKKLWWFIPVSILFILSMFLALIYFVQFKSEVIKGYNRVTSTNDNAQNKVDILVGKKQSNVVVDLGNTTEDILTAEKLDTKLQEKCVSVADYTTDQRVACFDALIPAPYILNDSTEKEKIEKLLSTYRTKYCSTKEETFQMGFYNISIKLPEYFRMEIVENKIKGVGESPVGEYVFIDSYLCDQRYSASFSVVFNNESLASSDLLRSECWDYPADQLASKCVNGQYLLSVIPGTSYNIYSIQDPWSAPRGSLSDVYVLPLDNSFIKFITSGDEVSSSVDGLDKYLKTVRFLK